MEVHHLTYLTIVIVLFLCPSLRCSETDRQCELGPCSDVLMCPILRPALSLNHLNSSQKVINIIKRYRCGGSESRSICCTDLAADLVRNNILADFMDENSTDVLAQLMTKPCGISDGSTRIIAGPTALLFEFPWMALLKYNTSNGKQFLCSGSLISDRYILTAAHCFFLQDAQLINVRLGEYDTSTEMDCEMQLDYTDCAPPATEYPVEDVFIHNDFKSWEFANDIALVRLARKVVYEDRVSPICLPVLKDLAENIEFGQTAGWGLTPTGTVSAKLQRVILPVLPNEVCGKIFGRNFTPSHLCAGGKPGKEICKGDSGGPLFGRLRNRQFFRYVLHGILSAGGKMCSGQDAIPSVYTNVVEYLPWIVKNMKP